MSVLTYFYTDEGRLAYFQSHNGSAPPPGTVIPTSNVTASGGYTWPHFVSQKLGSTTYNYAVSGAVCSNELVSRYLASIYESFPSVIDYEVPAFRADVAFAASEQPQSTFLRDRAPDNTLYTLWIGTNDLGVDAFLTDSQRPGATLTDFVECVWSVFDGLYGLGGRQFVLFAEAPLQLAPLYKSLADGGVGDNEYWTNKTAYNTTEYAQKMLEYSSTVNTVFAYGAPFELLVRRRWPGATLGLFDVHRLLLDIHDHGAAYLTPPANVTGPYQFCPADEATGEVEACEDSAEPESSFQWFDELHPSQQTDEHIAAALVDMLHGDSKYGTWY
ncbi:acetyl esterase [Xylariaceae sp. FL0804]|nr:acetyl esterase [Xylariaceae sp. FL0804]